MSEANILNPTQTHPFNPTYSFRLDDGDTEVALQARSGAFYMREVDVRGRVYSLQWNRLQTSDALALRNWDQQYRDGFFSYQDFDQGRYFTGRFLNKLSIVADGNNNYSVANGVFIEIPGKPMFSYPSVWGVPNSIFKGIRDDDGNDRVKLTGTWDHRTKNYMLRSEEIDNAAWANGSTGGAVAPVVTANATAAPDGTATAEQIDFAVTVAAQTSRIRNIPAPPAVKGQTFTFSIWLRAAAPLTLRILIEEHAAPFTGVSFDCAVTAVWQRFSVSLTVPAGSTSTDGPVCYLQNSASQPAKTVFAWGGQLEYGSAPSTYVKTVAAPVELPAPLANSPFLKGGFAYWNDGTDVNALAEIEYTGYGFRLYAPTNVDMGIMNLSVKRNGAVEVAATAIDLYSAAAVNSAVVSTQVNLPLGRHRVTLQGTNTKNAVSSAKNILFDSIEIMK
jgi:hypothetical protein